MSLTGVSNLFTTSQPKHTDPLFNLMKEITFIFPQLLRQESSDTDYEQDQDLPSVYLYANPLVSWLLLLASSSIFPSKNISFSGSSCACSSENSSEVSDFEKATYWDSLFDLEGEDSEWISDFESSSPLSTKSDSDSDSSSELSDSERVTYLDSLLSLEDEDCEWLSDSKPELDLIETQVVSSDEPLFWPFEEEFNCNSQESWSSFPISPRKHINSFLTTHKSSGLKQRKQKCHEAEPETRVVSSLEPLSVGKNFPEKIHVSGKQVPKEKGYFALDQQLSIETLVGLEEFDGHEGLDSEFYGNVFVLDE